MKYIIDVDKDRIDCSGQLFIAVDIPNGQSNYEIPTGIWVKDYTEPYRKAIEDEVWNLAREIAYCMSLQECKDAGMLCDDDIYNDASGVLEKLTYQEAKARYDDWKKSKDEIHVGDEIRHSKYNSNAVVTCIDDGKAYFIYDSGETGYCYDANSYWEKTGRHFDEVAELLKKMREEP